MGMGDYICWVVLVVLSALPVIVLAHGGGIFLANCQDYLF